MGVLQRDPIPKLCFAMVLTICKDFFADCKVFCHDLTDRSCPRLTPLINPNDIGHIVQSLNHRTIT